MKVLIFHQHFRLPFQAGSMRIYYFAKELIDNDHEVVIITGSSCREGISALGFKLSKKGITYHEFKPNQKILIMSLKDFYDQGLSFKKRLISFIYFTCLASILCLKIKGIDIVFASSTPLSIAIPALVTSKLRKVPFIFEVRDLWPEAPIQLGILKDKTLIFSARLLEKLAYKGANEIIGISLGICKKIEKISGKKAHFIPHGVDGQFFQQSPLRAGKRRSNKVKVIYAGSCGYNNAIEIFIEVAKLFCLEKDVRDLARFILIGDGPSLQALKGSIPENVKLLGKLPKSEVIKHLCSADIALFSQRKVNKGDLKKDSLPNKFFDFVGASLSIVAGAVKDGEMAQEIIRNSCGIVVEPEDVEALYAGVKRLILSNELRKQMSLAAGRLAMRYSRKVQSTRFVSLLEENLISSRCIKQ